MSHPIRFGFQFGQQNLPWEQLLDMWCKVDSWGYDSLWNFDHLYPIFTDPRGTCLEGWTTLSALAPVTKRARIGCLVNGNTYRNPCLTAKMAVTLDHISGGRLNLGIGAGWFELEHRAYGFDFKTVRGRLEALDEALRIMRGMFTQERTTVHGKHHTADDALALPKPLQKPYPPILIGGAGEKILLRIVAEHADMWNATGSAERMRRLIDVIARHGDKLGRDTSTIEKTVAMMFCHDSPEREQPLMQIAARMSQTSPEEARGQIMIGGKQECLDTIDRYVRAGVTHFIFMPFAPNYLDGVQAFAEEVIPAVRGKR